MMEHQNIHMIKQRVPNMVMQVTRAVLGDFVSTNPRKNFALVLSCLFPSSSQLFMRNSRTQMQTPLEKVDTLNSLPSRKTPPS